MASEDSGQIYKVVIFNVGAMKKSAENKSLDPQSLFDQGKMSVEGVWKIS